MNAGSLHRRGEQSVFRIDIGADVAAVSACGEQRKRERRLSRRGIAENFSQAPLRNSRGSKRPIHAWIPGCPAGKSKGMPVHRSAVPPAFEHTFKGGHRHRILPIYVGGIVSIIEHMFEDKSE